MQSIDIFDTAIFRDVYEPKDIFYLVEKQLGNCYAEKRILAEKLARQEKGCYNYNDIFQHLTDFKNHKDVELQVELDHCYANPHILKMYNKNPNNYVFISDMYLPSHFLRQLLMLNGYINPRVFVSCEMKAHKGDGTLFKEVIKRVGPIEKHYGDNYICDVVKAKENGIEPVFLPSLQNRKLNLPIIKNGMLKKYLALGMQRSAIERLALWFTPIIFNFTKWVLDNRKEGQKLFFLSRDMYLPYLIARDYFEAEDIYYLYASRRSLAALILQKSNNKSLKDKMCQILTREEIRQKQTEDITSCINYFKNMNISNDDIIVDVGYSGTVQEALRCLNIETQGLYMQIGENKYHVSMKPFFKREPLQYLLLMEFPLCSDEDSIESYKDNKPYFVPDIETRKKYSREIQDIVLNNIDTVSRFDCSVTELEQILINLQYYPDQEMLNLFNSYIYTNRSRVESGIGFDKDKIMKGELLDCYQKSYARPLFKKMLEQDDELAYLSKLLD